MIQKKGNEFIVKFNATFYSESSLNKTIEEFKDFCSISIKKEGNFFIAGFSSDDIEVPLEFSNHAFALDKIARTKNAGIN